VDTTNAFFPKTGSELQSIVHNFINFLRKCNSIVNVTQEISHRKCDFELFTSVFKGNFKTKNGCVASLRFLLANAGRVKKSIGGIHAQWKRLLLSL
jgi:hypothetical protein